MADNRLPQGIETTIRKARGNAVFKAQLLKDRAKAAIAAGIELEPAEAAMLDTIPVEQLEAVIESSKGRPWWRKPARAERLSDMRLMPRGIRPDTPTLVAKLLLRILVLAAVVVAHVLIVLHWWP